MKKAITYFLFLLFTGVLSSCVSSDMEEIESNFDLEMPVTDDDDDEHPEPPGQPGQN